MTMLSAIIVVGLGTYAMRALFLVTLSDKTFPPLALRLLEYVAPAVLGSLVISMLIDSEAQVALGAPELAGLAAAAIIAAKTPVMSWRCSPRWLFSGYCVGSREHH